MRAEVEKINQQIVIEAEKRLEMARSETEAAHQAVEKLEAQPLDPGLLYVEELEQAEKIIAATKRPTKGKGSHPPDRTHMHPGSFR